MQNSRHLAAFLGKFTDEIGLFPPVATQNIVCIHGSDVLQNGSKASCEPLHQLFAPETHSLPKLAVGFDEQLEVDSDSPNCDGSG